MAVNCVLYIELIHQQDPKGDSKFYARFSQYKMLLCKLPVAAH